MFLKKLLFVILAILSFQMNGQSPELRARAAILKAEDHISEGNFSEATGALERAIQYKGSTTARLEHLLTRCYFKTENFTEAKKHLKAYFELASENDVRLEEMLLMIENIREKEVSLLNNRLSSLHEDELFYEAKESGDSTIIFTYLQRFPEGAFVDDAFRLLTSFDSPPAILSTVYARYPDRAFSEEITTKTHTAVLISAEGKPVKIRHLQVHPYFVDAVEESITRSSYKPATLFDDPVSGWMMISYDFSLERTR